MKNKYNQAPLPFQGQKRRFLKSFKEALKSFPSDAVYVDLFGGSGLLSHTVKSVYPEAKVIYNDFDNYSERLKNIPKTNKILADFREILGNHPKEEKIVGKCREQILERLKAEKGFVDWVTISASIGFSMNYKTSLLEFEKDTLYCRLRQTDLCADGYLEGVERVQMDYKDLYDLYKNNDKVVFLIDPPYLSTDIKTYKNENYWKLTNYLEVLKCLQETKYFYFTSDKSQLIEFFQWMGDNVKGANLFDGAEIIRINTALNYGSKYQDIMIYKN